MKKTGQYFFPEKDTDDGTTSSESEIFKEDMSSPGSLCDLNMEDNDDDLQPLPVFEISSDEELETSMIQMEKMVSLEPDSSD